MYTNATLNILVEDKLVNVFNKKLAEAMEYNL
jgi:hypothetical protein